MLVKSMPYNPFHPFHPWMPMVPQIPIYKKPTTTETIVYTPLTPETAKKACLMGAGIIFILVLSLFLIVKYTK
jgi:hypothetical protein